MYLIKALLLLIMSVNLFANITLQHNYFVKNDFISLSDIIKNPKKDSILFQISNDRHSKRVKSKVLLKQLKALGYEDINSKYSYIQFSKKSPINRQELELFLKNSYLKVYPNLKIQSITISPRSYLESLPKEYKAVLSKKFFLKKEGTLYIKTLDNKKIFFNYLIDAKITLLVAKKEIQKGDEISWVNAQKKSIMLDKFRAMPLLKMQLNVYEAKHRIKADTIFTSRDITGLYLIKRGANVNVSLKESNLDISFGAKANQDGRFGDTISVINKSGKKLKVIVTGRNRAEIE